MSDWAVRKIVQDRARLAGVSEDLSAHSIRSGFVTQAGRARISLAETMKLADMRSVTTAMRYFREGDVVDSPAARLFDPDPESGT